MALPLGMCGPSSLIQDESLTHRIAHWVLTAGPQGKSPYSYLLFIFFGGHFVQEGVYMYL